MSKKEEQLFLRGIKMDTAGLNQHTRKSFLEKGKKMQVPDMSQVIEIPSSRPKPL